MFLREASMPRVRFGGHVHLVLGDYEYLIEACCRQAMLGPRAYPGMANPTGALAGERMPLDAPVDCPECLASMRDPAVNT